MKVLIDANTCIIKNIPKYLIAKIFQISSLISKIYLIQTSTKKICQRILEKQKQEPSFSKFVNSETYLISYQIFRKAYKPRYFGKVCLENKIREDDDIPIPSG